MESDTIHNQNYHQTLAFDHSSIESHPDEILIQIFDYLSITNRVAISRATKRVEKVVKDINKHVKSVMITTNNRKPDWTDKKAANFCSIEDHKFGDNWICIYDVNYLWNVLRALPNLKALDISSMQKTDWRNFKVYDRNFFNNVDLLQVLEQHKSLEHIHILRSESTLNYATSKITCIWEESSSQVNGDHIATLQSLTYLKTRGHIEVEHIRTLLKMNLVSLNVLEALTDHDFWKTVFENGADIENLGSCRINNQLHDININGLTNLKRVTLSGDFNTLEIVLRLPKIESVKYSLITTDIEDMEELNEQFHDALQENGKKLKYFGIDITDTVDEEEHEIDLDLDSLTTIAQTCPNLEHLKFQDGPALNELLELDLGQLFPRLHYLDMFSKCQLFERIPSLVALHGQPDIMTHGPTVTYERQDDRVMATG